MKQREANPVRPGLQHDDTEDNGLLWLLLCGALFVLIFLPLVA